MEENRTWKWAVPGLLCLTLMYWGMQVAAVSGEQSAVSSQQSAMNSEQSVGVFMVIVGIFLGAVSITNWWRLVSSHNADLYALRRDVDSSTPLVRLSENMKQMHPEAVRVLNRFGVKTSWGVSVNVERGERDWVLLDTDPSVHFGFIEFVLDNSAGGRLMPMGSFAEGAKKWDPDGLIDDREQYQALRKWMFVRMMITEAHGNQPPYFIPPWNCETLKDAMGLTGEQDLYQPNLDEGRVDLGVIPASKSQMDKLPRKAEQAEVKNEPNMSPHPALTDEEWNAIQKENGSYREKYMS